VVPNVVGKTLARATRALSARHCRLGTVSRVASTLRKKGHVLRESPAAGKRLRHNAKVNLWLGKGPAKRK
jgi:beta-lactam-binding protein with PASTA domain